MELGQKYPSYPSLLQIENLHSTRRVCADILFLGLRSSSDFVYDLVNMLKYPIKEKNGKKIGNQTANSERAVVEWFTTFIRN